MEFKDLLEWAKAEAIANTIQSNELGVWRQVCRNYSKKFATPLHLCLDGTICPEQILLAEFEDQLDEFDQDKHLESILEQVYRLEDPDYDREKDEELSGFIKKAEKEEIERVKAGKPIHRAIKNTDEVSLPQTPEEEKPKKGSINLSYLEREESQMGGFED